MRTRPSQRCSTMRQRTRVARQLSVTFASASATVSRTSSASARTPSRIRSPRGHQRKERYVAHLEEASPSALRVSLADKLHNVRSILRDHGEIGEKVWERFNADRDEILWYYRSLAEVFARRCPGRMAEEMNLPGHLEDNRAQEAGVMLAVG